MSNSLLHIETSGKLCSIAISQDGKLKIEKIAQEENAHGEMVTLFMQACLEELGLSVSDLSAVSVNAGPGSYTGLRIGLSAAKGLCLALDIPLIGVSSFTSLYAAANGREECVATVLDSRQNEVYIAVFPHSKDFIAGPRVVDEILITELEGKGVRCLIGNGLDKFEDIPFEKVHADCKANQQIEEAWQKFHKQDFADLVNYTPEYMKPVHVNLPKKRHK